MNEKIKKLITKLKNQNLTINEFNFILSNYDETDLNEINKIAYDITTHIFGNKIYFRGIIEFSNYCKNDCLYCGLRASNKKIERYRLNKQQILDACIKAYNFGFRTFVLQSGEDVQNDINFHTDVVKSIREKFSDCAITLSIGELATTDYKKLFDAGANRFLLRHEAANENLYKKLHTETQNYKNRMRCLNDLKEIGFQVGVGMMVGAPFQTTNDLSEDLFFIQNFKPHMVGLGPFIPHKDTPFRKYLAGDENLNLIILSIIRIMFPHILLPATTALGTIDKNGRKKGVLAGCNVIMPNITPFDVKNKYTLYDNKIGLDTDMEDGLKTIKNQMKEIGKELFISRGDYE